MTHEARAQSSADEFEDPFDASREMSEVMDLLAKKSESLMYYVMYDGYKLTFATLNGLVFISIWPGAEKGLQELAALQVQPVPKAKGSGKSATPSKQHKRVMVKPIIHEQGPSAKSTPVKSPELKKAKGTSDMSASSTTKKSLFAEPGLGADGSKSPSPGGGAQACQERQTRPEDLAEPAEPMVVDVEAGDEQKKAFW